MSRILVTGGGGQLATAAERALPDRVIRIGRPEFDFDVPATIEAALDTYRPALVLNAAAWTAVDAAEQAPEAADRANHTGPAALAAACFARGIQLIHISTDYVFDGTKGAPYWEFDTPNPTGVYGATKLAGERAVLAAHPQAAVLRTSWVYATTGKNFVLTMLNAAKRMPVLRVVADQIGCPTNADDLAAACLAVADRLLAVPDHWLGGIYHVAGQGSTSWHGFAEAIFAAAARHGRPVPQVDAIATADWPTPARRPADSRLDCSKLKGMFGVVLPSWQDSLEKAVAEICAHDAPGMREANAASLQPAG